MTIERREAILKSMLNYSDIDDILKALVEPTRRQIVERLSRGPASVSELARPFDMSLAAIVQHLQVLEESGLIRSEKIGRVRTCRIEPSGLDRIAGWVAERRSLMERRFDRLGEMLSQPDVNNQIDKQQEEKE
ncbi:DNA-binding transcriptional ArsR family regulator [Rhizobium pisi]|uniref:DNA-binding transcriptional ArsR family regulator n=2 Tax=Rhizobium pisi TaxID=574561 RepID=A0A7W5BP56_9HYPH|nr:DNA-binding transcriptional ArsR family regulator [Rhizobium pisi]